MSSLGGEDSSVGISRFRHTVLCALDIQGYSTSSLRFNHYFLSQAIAMDTLHLSVDPTECGMLASSLWNTLYPLYALIIGLQVIWYKAGQVAHLTATLGALAGAHTGCIIVKAFHQPENDFSSSESLKVTKLFTDHIEYFKDPSLSLLGSALYRNVSDEVSMCYMKH